jgi:pimeloyl-ACP methyl ester carboxylesterase
MTWRPGCGWDDVGVGSGRVADLVPMSGGCPLWTQATGAGRPVVLCHGGPGLWDYLAPLARLAGPGYRVHRYDQRGCGRSGALRPWTLERFITDLDGVRAHFGYPRWIVGAIRPVPISRCVTRWRIRTG